jgi:hypothetical protein
MNDEVVIAAKAFAEHCFSCLVCSTPGPECCPDGDLLLRDFHDALNASLLKRTPRKDVN